ncbi:MAG: Csu type fimbrial protein [Lysobacter sp.]
MNAIKSALCAAMLVACAASGSAGAADCAASPCEAFFEVYLEVVASCEFVSTNDVAFGNQTVVPGQSLEAFGSLRVRCNVPVAYQIGLDQGLHGTGINDRKMVGPGGDTIAYQLYSGDTGTTACNDAGAQWGNTTGDCMYGDSYTGTEQDIQIHGKLTMGNPRAGSYSDTITATIKY